MMWLALVALIQAPGQETPIEERIESCLTGDEAARKELLAMGAYAIRPLQGARDKNPEKVDLLLRELKRGATYPKEFQLADKFRGRRIMVTDGGIELKPFFLKSFCEGGVPIFLDPFDPSKLKSVKFTLEKVDSPLGVIEEICTQMGLDYGFFHNAVVLGFPDRLWPSGPPVKVPDLGSADLARAKELVEKLGDELIVIRESAMKDLFNLGWGVAPILEANRSRKEGEIASRCATLIDRLKPRLQGSYGPTGAERQSLSRDDDDLIKKLFAVRVSVDFKARPVREIIRSLSQSSSIPMDTGSVPADKLSSIHLQDHQIHAILALVTQSQGFDFTIRDGQVHVDSREVVERKLKERD